MDRDQKVVLRLAALVLVLAAAALVIAQSRSRERARGSDQAPQAKKPGASTWTCGSGAFPPPPTSITPALAQIPLDICGVAAQGNFDSYSWLTFIALNWPANAATCSADTSQSILTGTGPRVWETFLSSSEIFVTPGQQPSSWCPQQAQAIGARWETLPLWVREATQRTGVRRVIRQVAKATPAVLPEFQSIDEAVGGTLTDQNGRFVRYEIRINQDEYNYITTNSLWSLNGQQSFTPPVNFPASNTSTGTVGAMEVKAAWKVLGANDDASRFYTIQAIVFNDAQDDPSPCPNPVTLGLVGLHIIHKTQSQKSWIWSTFEHIDNTTKSFYNPNCPASQCPPNKQTAVTTYEENQNCTPANSPVQVTRVSPIATNDPSAVTANATYQALLKGSVWQNYQLIGTQWLGETGLQPVSGLLANTTLETFIQTTSSCYGCHKTATLPQRTNVSADFSFALDEAQ